MRNAFRFSQHLKAALEQKPAVAVEAVEEEVVAAPEGGEQVVEVVTAPNRELEDSLIAADDAGDRVSDTCDEAEDLERATAQLESILNSIQEETNGLDPVSAKYARHAIESITADWGLEESLVPSTESFGGNLSRREATIALESNVKEIIKQVIQYLKDLWAKIVEFAKKAYNHLFDVATHTGNRAEALIKAAGSLEGEPHQAEIDITALAHRFLTSDKVPSDFAEAVKEMSQSIGAILAHGPGEQDQAVAKLFADLVTAKTDEEFEKAHAEVIKALDEAKADYKGNGLFSENGGKRTKVLPGGWYFEFENGRYIKRREEIKVEDAKIKTLSPEQVKHTAEAVKVFAHNVGETIGHLRQAKPLVETMMKEMISGEHLSEANAKKASALAHRIGADASRGIDMLISFLNLYVSGAAAVLGVAEKSAAEYGPHRVRDAAAAAKEKAGAAGAAVKEGAEKAGAAVKEAAGTAGAAVKSAADKAAAAVKGAVGGKEAEAA